MVLSPSGVGAVAGTATTGYLAGVTINSANNLSTDIRNAFSSNGADSGRTSEAEFASSQKFDKHYDKHVTEQGEFGNISKEEYLNKANDFIKSDGADVLTKTASNGDVLKWNKLTDEFSIVTKDGVIRTYHRLNPEIHGEGSNLDYWNGAKCNY